MSQPPPPSRGGPLGFPQPPRPHGAARKRPRHADAAGAHASTAKQLRRARDRQLTHDPADSGGDDDQGSSGASSPSYSDGGSGGDADSDGGGVAPFVASPRGSDEWARSPPPSPVPYSPGAALASSVRGMRIGAPRAGDEDDGDASADDGDAYRSGGASPARARTDADELNAAVGRVLGAARAPGARPAGAPLGTPPGARATRARSPDREQFGEDDLARPAQPVARVAWEPTRDELVCASLDGCPAPELRHTVPCWLCLVGDLGAAKSRNAYIQRIQRVIDRGYGHVSNWDLAGAIERLYEASIRPALRARGHATIALPAWKIKEHIEWHSLNPRFIVGETLRHRIETIARLRQCGWERDTDTGLVTPSQKNLKLESELTKQLLELYKVDQSKLAFYVAPERD